MPSTTLREISLLQMLSESNHIVKWVCQFGMLVPPAVHHCFVKLGASCSLRSTASSLIASACGVGPLQAPVCGAPGGERQAVPLPCV